MVSWYNAGMEKKTIILVALAIIAIMNIVAFVLMGYDKRCARQGKRRVPEKALFWGRRALADGAARWG